MKKLQKNKIKNFAKNSKKCKNFITKKFLISRKSKKVRKNFTKIKISLKILKKQKITQIKKFCKSFKKTNF